MPAISKPLEMGTTNYVAVFFLLRSTIVANVSLYLPECSLCNFSSESWFHVAVNMINHIV